MKNPNNIKKSRGFIAVSNNPQRYYDWAAGFDSSKASEQDYQDLLQRSIEPFINPANNKPRDPALNGVMCVAEKSPSGTFHLHHVFCSKNSVRFEVLQKAYAHSRIEKAYGDAASNRDYIFKEGSSKNAAKKETQLCEPLVWGDWFGTDADRDETLSGKGVLARIDKMLDDGMTPNEICAVSASYAYHQKTIEALYVARCREQMPARRDVSVYYHVGRSGSGKTECYDELLCEHPAHEVVKLTCSKNTFDDYFFEPYVVLDEIRGCNFNPSSSYFLSSSDECDIPLSTLLEALDVRTSILGARYRNKPWCPKEIHLTSVYPPEKLYNFTGYEAQEQLFRRLTWIVYHWIDNDGNFRRYQIPGNRYTNFHSLKTEAEETGGDIVPIHRHNDNAA